MSAYQKNDYQRAASLLQEAVAKGANDSGTLYNAACAVALTGNSEKAFQLLERAIKSGFRNPTHLKSDPDLNSLHNDPRWDKTVAECALQQSTWIKNHNEPANATFVTSDIDRFWKAYDKGAGASVDERIAIFQREYIDGGTQGLKDWIVSGRLNAKTLVKTIDSHQEFFKSIRSLTSRIQTHRNATIEAFKQLRTYYPDAIFPDVYFVIGQLQSGGTASDNGLLMGAEMFTRESETPRGELTEWQKNAIAPQSDIPALVAHESIHFQQKGFRAGLLCACLKEGGADFLGRLAAGRLIERMETAHKWADTRERELWIEFEKEVDSEDITHWLYGSSGGNGRPVDLGYWMGYKISEAYYNNSAGKRQAVKDIVQVKDCKAFLKASRYAEKFATKTSN